MKIHLGGKSSQAQAALDTPSSEPTARWQEFLLVQSPPVQVRSDNKWVKRNSLAKIRVVRPRDVRAFG